MISHIHLRHGNATLRCRAAPQLHSKWTTPFQRFSNPGIAQHGAVHVPCLHRSLQTLSKTKESMHIIGEMKRMELMSNMILKMRKEEVNHIERGYSTERSPVIDIQEEVDQRKRMLIGSWLAFAALAVFGLVLVGGVTRLTESGLSITEWKPFRGAMPPTSLEEWEAEFDKYKESPEFKKLNFGMTLEEFKFIFWMEWAHREYARSMGIIFGVPFAYFTLKGWMDRSLLLKCLGLFTLGGAQGAMGWFMVKSGLDHATFDENNTQPRVSQYRLAAHLSLAITLFASMLYMATDQLLGPTIASKAISDPRVLRLRRFSLFTLGLVGVTAFSGAFVAGLDAGLVYNTFPLMGDQWIPDGVLSKKPLWKNIFENEATVQFDHRYLGMSTFAAITAFYAYAMKQVPKQGAPKFLRGSLHALFGMASLQVLLGITTLLTYVPVPIAATHQGGALTLLGISTFVVHQMKRIKKLPIK